MVNSREIIIQLKEVREAKNLSFAEIMTLMEKNGDYISKGTLSRIFAEGSEDLVFKYEETIRPVANALLDIERIEEDDDLDVKAMKALLKYKNQRIVDLEHQIEKLKAQYDKDLLKQHQKIEKERTQSRTSIEFLKNQIELKDQRMDMFMNAIVDKEHQNMALLDHIINCPLRVKGECNQNNILPMKE